MEAGETRGEAEHAALLEFGDPTRLAARYAQNPAALIGPATYHAYLKAWPWVTRRSCSC